MMMIMMVVVIYKALPADIIVLPTSVLDPNTITVDDNDIGDSGENGDDVDDDVDDVDDDNDNNLLTFLLLMLFNFNITAT